MSSPSVDKNERRRQRRRKYYLAHRDIELNRAKAYYKNNHVRARKNAIKRYRAMSLAYRKSLVAKASTSNAPQQVFAT
jgi:hypothetical protein